MKKGKIYLSEQRGLIENDNIVQYCTFNFGTYFNEHKDPFDTLKLLNEEFLAGSGKVLFKVEEPTHVLILPVTGDLYFSSESMIGAVDVEEIQICSLTARRTYQIVNPYPANRINYLHLQLAVNTETPFLEVFKFDLQSNKNTLQALLGGGSRVSQSYSISMGIFDGRYEASYASKHKTSRIFAFVLSGAFEMEGRLLHAGDGLGLWESPEIEFEALSDNATVLILELI